MKVRELIEKLQKFDPELLAVTGGFDENGYDPVSDPELVYIQQAPKAHSHAPEYQEACGGPLITAVLINF